MSLKFDDTPTKQRCVMCKREMRWGMFSYHWAPKMVACSRYCLRMWLRGKRRHQHRQKVVA